MKELGKLKKFNLNQYIIKGSETEWNDALGKGIKGKNLISIKRYFFFFFFVPYLIST